MVFRSLDAEDLKKIGAIQLPRVEARLARQDLAVTITEGAQEVIAKAGYDPQFGARPLRRAIERLMENALARELLDGRPEVPERPVLFLHLQVRALADV